jgi:hypothetical protein
MKAIFLILICLFMVSCSSTYSVYNEEHHYMKSEIEKSIYEGFGVVYVIE